MHLWGSDLGFRANARTSGSGDRRWKALLGTLLVILLMLAVSMLFDLRRSIDVQPPLPQRAAEVRPIARLTGDSRREVQTEVGPVTAALNSEPVGSAPVRGQVSIIGALYTTWMERVPGIALSLDLDGKSITEAWTDGDGRFSFKFPAPGEDVDSQVRVRGRAPASGVLDWTGRIRGTGDLELTVNLLTSDSVIHLEGRLEYEDSRPVQAGWVVGERGEPAVRTRRNGTFSLECPTWNEFVLLTYGSGVEEQPTTFSSRIRCSSEQVRAKLMSDVVLVVPAPDTNLVIEVAGVERQPIAEARVAVDGDLEPASTDIFGRCRIRCNLRAAKNLVVKKGGYATELVSLAEVDLESPIRLVLQKTASLVGYVVDVGGATCAGATVEISSHPAGEGDVARVGTDSAGAFSFRGVPEGGEYWFIARTTDGRQGEALRPSRANSDPTRIVVQPRQVIRGRVLSALKSPVSAATVFAIREDRGEIGSTPTSTDPNGNYELPVSAGGRYRLNAIARGHGRGEAVGFAGDAVDLHLPVCGIISGRVACGSELLDRGFAVWASAPDGRGGWKRCCLQQRVIGRREFMLELPTLPPGSCSRLTFSFGADGIREVEATVGDRASFELTVPLP